MSLDRILTENALKQFAHWAWLQPELTYEFVDFGDDDYHLRVKACYENDTVHDSISLEAFDNATKWLSELEESDVDAACPIDRGQFFGP